LHQTVRTSASEEYHSLLSAKCPHSIVYVFYEYSAPNMLTDITVLYWHELTVQKRFNTADKTKYLKMLHLHFCYHLWSKTIMIMFCILWQIKLN